MSFLGIELPFLVQNGMAAWTAKRLTWNSGSSRYPAIELDSSSHVHLVWQDETPSNAEIYYKHN